MYCNHLRSKCHYNASFKMTKTVLDQLNGCKISQPSGLPQVSFYLRCYIGCWKYGWLSLIENNFRTLFCVYDFLADNKMFNRRKKLKIIQIKKN